MSLPRLLEPAFAQLAHSIADGAAGSTILCVQDSTDVDLTHLRATSGMGVLRMAYQRGFYMHAALAVATNGVPLGLLGAQTFVRDPAERGKSQFIKQRPFEEKESSWWWTMLEETERRVNLRGRLLTIGDRGADVLDIMARSAVLGYRLLLRAAQDRCVGEANRDWEYKHLWETVLTTPARARKKVWLSRQARWAELTLRWSPILIRDPTRVAQRVPVWAVHVMEEQSVEGVDEPIEWMLLTTDAIETDEQAWQRVRWYVLRWKIEEFFRVLKTGCRAEQRQFESRASYEVALSFFLLAAARVLALRDEARDEPDQPALTVLSEQEVKVLRSHAAQEGEPLPTSLTNRDVNRAIAKMGGFMGRKSDGEPGPITLWRGFCKLHELVQGYRLALADAGQDSFRPP